MPEPDLPEPCVSETIRGEAIIQSLVKSQVDFVVALPDIVTCDTVLWPLSRREAPRLIPVCKEDEGVSICAALSYCERRAVLLMQHTGFLDSVNAIRAIAAEYQLPVVMIVGLQGMEADTPPASSAKLGIRCLEPICDSLDIRFDYLAANGDEAIIPTAIETAYAGSAPLVLFVPYPPE